MAAIEYDTLAAGESDSDDTETDAEPGPPPPPRGGISDIGLLRLIQTVAVTNRAETILLHFLDPNRKGEDYGLLFKNVKESVATIRRRYAELLETNDTKVHRQAKHDAFMALFGVDPTSLVHVVYADTAIAKAIAYIRTHPLTSQRKFAEYVDKDTLIALFENWGVRNIQGTTEHGLEFLRDAQPENKAALVSLFAGGRPKIGEARKSYPKLFSNVGNWSDIDWPALRNHLMYALFGVNVDEPFGVNLVTGKRGVSASVMDALVARAKRMAAKAGVDESMATKTVKTYYSVDEKLDPAEFAPKATVTELCEWLRQNPCLYREKIYVPLAPFSPFTDGERALLRGVNSVRLTSPYVSLYAELEYALGLTVLVVAQVYCEALALQRVADTLRGGQVAVKPVQLAKQFRDRMQRIFGNALRRKLNANDRQWIKQHAVNTPGYVGQSDTADLRTVKDFVESWFRRKNPIPDSPVSFADASAKGGSGGVDRARRTAGKSRSQGSATKPAQKKAAKSVAQKEKEFAAAKAAVQEATTKKLNSCNDGSKEGRWSTVQTISAYFGTDGLLNKGMPVLKFADGYAGRYEGTYPSPASMMVVASTLNRYRTNPCSVAAGPNGKAANEDMAVVPVIVPQYKTGESASRVPEEVATGLYKLGEAVGERVVANVNTMNVLIDAYSFVPQNDFQSASMLVRLMHFLEGVIFAIQANAPQASMYSVIVCEQKRTGWTLDSKALRQLVSGKDFLQSLVAVVASANDQDAAIEQVKLGNREQLLLSTAMDERVVEGLNKLYTFFERSSPPWLQLSKNNWFVNFGGRVSKRSSVSDQQMLYIEFFRNLVSATVISPKAKKTIDEWFGAISEAVNPASAERLALELPAAPAPPASEGGAAPGPSGGPVGSATDYAGLVERHKNDEPTMRGTFGRVVIVGDLAIKYSDQRPQDLKIILAVSQAVPGYTVPVYYAMRLDSGYAVVMQKLNPLNRQAAEADGIIEAVLNLMQRGFYVIDCKEDNFGTNPKTGKVLAIDLDGIVTVATTGVYPTWGLPVAHVANMAAFFGVASDDKTFLGELLRAYTYAALVCTIMFMVKKKEFFHLSVPEKLFQSDTYLCGRTQADKPLPLQGQLILLQLDRFFSDKEATKLNSVDFWKDFKRVRDKLVARRDAFVLAQIKRELKGDNVAGYVSQDVDSDNVGDKYCQRANAFAIVEDGADPSLISRVIDKDMNNPIAFYEQYYRENAKLAAAGQVVADEALAPNVVQFCRAYDRDTELYRNVMTVTCLGLDEDSVTGVDIDYQIELGEAFDGFERAFNRSIWIRVFEFIAKHPEIKTAVVATADASEADAVGGAELAQKCLAEVRARYGDKDVVSYEEVTDSAVVEYTQDPSRCFIDINPLLPGGNSTYEWLSETNLVFMSLPRFNPYVRVMRVDVTSTQAVREAVQEVKDVMRSSNLCPKFQDACVGEPVDLYLQSTLDKVQSPPDIYVAANALVRDDHINTATRKLLKQAADKLQAALDPTSGGAPAPAPASKPAKAGSRQQLKGQGKQYPKKKNREEKTGLSTTKRAAKVDEQRSQLNSPDSPPKALPAPAPAPAQVKRQGGSPSSPDASTRRLAARKFKTAIVTGATDAVSSAVSLGSKINVYRTGGDDVEFTTTLQNVNSVISQAILNHLLEPSYLPWYKQVVTLLANEDESLSEINMDTIDFRRFEAFLRATFSVVLTMKDGSKKQYGKWDVSRQGNHTYVGMLPSPGGEEVSQIESISLE